MADENCMLQRLCCRNGCCASNTESKHITFTRNQHQYARAIFKRKGRASVKIKHTARCTYLYVHIYAQMHICYFCVSKAISHFWKSSAPQKSLFSWKFVIWHVPRVHPCKPWPSLIFFYILWIGLKRCMRKAMTSMAAGKILLAKTNWWLNRNLHFSKKSNYIVCAPVATQHTHCH